MIKDRLLLVLVIYCSIGGWLFSAELQQSIDSPGRIVQKYIYGQNKDPQEAKRLLILWLEEKRHSEEYRDSHDTNFASAVHIIKEANGDESVDEFLRNELKLTKSRRSRYALLQQLARRRTAEKKCKEAISLWKQAREAVSSGKHPYYTTRQALPLIEIGLLHQELKQDEAARKYFEMYVASDYGRGEANGMVETLGDIYEESGEWDKAKQLYEHYHQFEYYKNHRALNDRLQIPSLDTLNRAKVCLQNFADDSKKKQRQARLELFSLIESSERKDLWMKWLKKQSGKESKQKIITGIKLVLPLFTPLEEIGKMHPSDVKNSLERMKNQRSILKPYGDIHETIFSYRIRHKYQEAPAALFLGGSFTINELSANTDFRDTLETVYSQIRRLILEPGKDNPLKAKLPKISPETVSPEMTTVLQENPTFRDYLKKCISFQSPQFGYAIPLLFAFGYKDDIDFIIENIPQERYLRNSMMFGLAAGLYREGVVDIPEVLGVSKKHVRDWWNLDVNDNVDVKSVFRRWWQENRETFDYTPLKSSGRRLVGPGITSSITNIVLAPEIEGLFFTFEGGFQGYDASLHYFTFTSGDCIDLLSGGHDGGRGRYSSKFKWSRSGEVSSLGNVYWDASKMRCEFSISNEEKYAVFIGADKGIVKSIDKIDGKERKIETKVSLGAGIQRFGNLTYELRYGDLYLVNEETEEEQCLIDYGYILSFALNKDRTKVIVADREIMGLAFRLYDVSDRANF